MPTGNLYGLLGVDPAASLDEIKAAYRVVARRFHPDVNPSVGAADEFRRVADAYSVLGDPAQRGAYDASLKQAAGKPVIAIQALLSRSVLPTHPEPQVVYALAEVRPLIRVTDIPPAPVNLCLVIDRSTSMQGVRLDQVKAAVIRVIDGLRESDSLAVVAFSDRAEVVVPPIVGTPEQKNLARAKVSTLNAGGGTEILKGLLRGMLELQHRLSPAAVNHLMLLTDGRTYGDEGHCLLLAALAAQDGISISGLGIGDEWNDRFLDELTSLTGSTTAFIQAPEQVTEFIQTKVRGLGAAYAERVALTVLTEPETKLTMAYKVAPEAGPLAPDDALLQIGNLPKQEEMTVLLKFQVPPVSEGTRFVARLALTADIISLGRRNERATTDLILPVVPKPSLAPPPPALVEALGKLTQHRLQERAQQDIAAGDVVSATQRLSTLGSRLLATGNTELAQAVLHEARKLEQSSLLTEEAKKNLKYGTRALLAAPRRQAPA